jgi:hypothetical protein
MNGNPFDPRRRQRRFGDPEFTRRVLDRTTGPACGRAETLLGDRWDRDLATVDASLLQDHLARCPACRRLAVVLVDLRPLLAGMAAREPGPAFTASVLAATTGPARAAAAPLRGYELWALRLQAALRRAWQRPRFALEAAWTAAALASLLVLSPLAPPQAPEQLSRAVQAGAHAVPELVQAAERHVSAAITAGRRLIAPPVAWIQDRSETISRSLRARGDQPDNHDEI